MAVETKSFQKYQQMMKEKELDVCLLTKEEEDIERLVKMLIKVDSRFIYPKDQNISLQMHAKKLIDNGINIIVADKSGDVGLLCFYANDYISKTAFCSAIGVVTSYRGGNIAKNLVKFGIDCTKEVGMDFVRVEVDKNNPGVVAFLKRFNFHIESETENNSYLLILDLRERQPLLFVE